MNKITRFVIVAGSLALLTGWGGTGHNKINYNTTLFFPKEMADFTSWKSTLAQHASDADNRKGSDLTESKKHYIDIDNYNEFISSGKIPENYRTIVALHGLSFVENQGILPWATITTEDSLKSAFQRHDWNKAVLFASDLGHYVGDGHMPLHLTKDYNGRDAGSRGIHTPRYESTMIDRFEQQIVFTPDTARYVSDASRFIFDYIYENNKFVDSVYYADSLGRSKGSTGSDVYYSTMWKASSAFTIKLFNNASKRLASLIYTAWVNAGKPQLNSTSVEKENSTVEDFQLSQNYPNPFNPETVINYSLNTAGHVRLSLFNVLGKEVAVIADGEKPAGQYSVKVNASAFHLGSGVYFYRLSGEGTRSLVRKMTVLQ